MNGTVRYWRNLGDGRFDLPRPMPEAPAGISLADAGVQFIDADGDGRTDLLVTQGVLAGYFPLQFGGMWDRRSFQRYREAPSFDLKDPEVRLLDLTAMASRTPSGPASVWNASSTIQQKAGRRKTRAGWNGKSLAVFPNVNFSDPASKLGGHDRRRAAGHRARPRRQRRILAESAATATGASASTCRTAPLSAMATIPGGS